MPIGSLTIKLQMLSGVNGTTALNKNKICIFLNITQENNIYELHE